MYIFTLSYSSTHQKFISHITPFTLIDLEIWNQQKTEGLNNISKTFEQCGFKNGYVAHFIHGKVKSVLFHWHSIDMSYIQKI